MAKKTNEVLVVGKKAKAETKEVKQPTKPAVKAKTPVKAAKSVKQEVKPAKPVDLKAPLVVPVAHEDKLPWDDVAQSGKVKMSTVMAIGGANTQQAPVLPTFKTK